VRPIHKIRTSKERYHPGGGGVNVARVIRELGGEALAVYLAGGTTGGVLDALVDATGLPRRTIPIEGDTRISYMVYERSSGQEYRFVPQGPELRQEEWQACLAEFDALEFDYLVASGSVPAGLPADCYREVAEVVAGKGARLVLDTSGDALRRALDHGVYLIKPNLRELEGGVGRSLREPGEQERAARELLERGSAEIVTVSLGAEGALLATSAGCRRLRAPKIEPKSAVGAGDSFVAAMTYGLAAGRAPEDAFMLALAAGTAAVLTKGTELCRRADVERIYREIQAERAGAGPTR